MRLLEFVTPPSRPSRSRAPQKGLQPPPTRSPVLKQAEPALKSQSRQEEAHQAQVPGDIGYFEAVRNPRGLFPRGPLKASEYEDCAIGKPKGQALKVLTSSLVASRAGRTDTTGCVGDVTRMLAAEVRSTSTLDVGFLEPCSEPSRDALYHPGQLLADRSTAAGVEGDIAGGASGAQRAPD
ncbi:hypothetical protein AMTR_s00070p00191880 [Amborella trichopoda]|uniref:Uncharacterized protein n=1 Tax=Amborella trichopoda TaxID=13333 RepID=U5DGR4_AMBTC|nr:hypothetical protein AMTR_s00070p00191880 [Amborella trichopoda]